MTVHLLTGSGPAADTCLTCRCRSSSPTAIMSPESLKPSFRIQRANVLVLKIRMK